MAEVSPWVKMGQRVLQQIEPPVDTSLGGNVINQMAHYGEPQPPPHVRGPNPEDLDRQAQRKASLDALALQDARERQLAALKAQSDQAEKLSGQQEIAQMLAEMRAGK